MKSDPVFQKYQRIKNVRSTGPVVRVNRGYFYFNKLLCDSIDCDMIDLYVNTDDCTVLIKPGKDFKLTFTANGRATFSAAHFINEFKIREEFYSARAYDGGMIFSYQIRQPV
jgi:hypothetical protein